jgi:hypothetical protein
MKDRVINLKHFRETATRALKTQNLIYPSCVLSLCDEIEWLRGEVNKAYQEGRRDMVEGGKFDRSRANRVTKGFSCPE